MKTLRLLVPLLVTAALELPALAKSLHPVGRLPHGTMKSGVAGSTAFISLHVDAAQGQRGDRIRAWMTNGDPNGVAEWFEATVTLPFGEILSASGRARLEFWATDSGIDGTVTLDGIARNYAAHHTHNGGGLYRITVGHDGRWTGESLAGWQMEAVQDGLFVRGMLIGPDGQLSAYGLVDMAQAFGWKVGGVEAGTYTVHLCNRGFTQLGRGGEPGPGAGSPGSQGLALDLWNSEEVTPGTYWGKVDRTIHQLMIVLDQPSGNQRRVRVYLAGEPQPEGDIEWFVGSESAGQFALISASGKAAIAGTVNDTFVTGWITLPNGQQRRYFAIAAGDGAGIYDVTVVKEKGNLRILGVSDNGNTLDLLEDKNTGQAVGSVTMANGRRIEVKIHDLTRVYRMPVAGSAPDTYLAFASPRAHDVIGRSGLVKLGMAADGIIGLDKCDF